MAKRDYIPARDGEFLSWEQNFINYCSANMTALGLVSGDLTPLLADQPVFEADYLALLPAQAAAKAAKEGRDDRRAEFVVASGQWRLTIEN